MPRWSGLTLEDRFWSKVEKSEEGCWTWTAFKMKSGYGMFARHLATTHSQLAHRWAWEFSNKLPVPEGMQVLHHCDNPACVRPDHLFLGTQMDNNRDKASKGRHHNQLKTHCRNGHPYSEENTWISHRPMRNTYARMCIICNLKSKKRYAEKKLASIQ